MNKDPKTLAHKLTIRARTLRAIEQARLALIAGRNDTQQLRVGQVRRWLDQIEAAAIGRRMD